MANKSAVLAVKIISDAKDFKKGTDDASDSVKKLGDGLKNLAIPALAVGAGILKLGSDYTKMASEFEQNSGAVDAVFKGNADQINKFSAESAKKLGLSGSDYKQYAALIGSQLKNAGVPMDQLAGKTDAMINQAADFAAQFGGTVPDAVEAMSSALKGEFDPMEKYGISMSAAKIEAEAMAMGAQKVNGELTDQAKMAAITSLMNKQGADAMGANAREADTAAGRQARLTASYEDMGVKLGTMLLPIMGQLADMLMKVVDWVSQNQELVGVLAVALGVLVGSILVLNGVMIVMNAIAALNPWVLIAVAVVALVGFIIYLATQTKFFQTVWEATAKFCSEAWAVFAKFATDVWNGFVGFLQDTLGNIGNFFKSIFSGIGNFVGGVLRNIGSFFSSAFNFARSVVQGVVSGIQGAISGMGNVIGSILNWITSIFSANFNNASNIVNAVINGIVTSFNRVSGAVQSVIGWVRNLFNGFSVPGWLRDVMRFMGVGATGITMSAGYDLSGLPAGMGATGTGTIGGILGGGSGGRTEVNNYHITVNGAIDPQGTARQIKAILTNDATRNGKIAAGGSLW